MMIRFCAAAAMGVSLLTGFCGAASAAPREVTIADAKGLPESITMAPGGILILGSSGSPHIYRALPGASVARPWIDVSADGDASFLGVMADAPTNTLWACEIIMEPQRRSQLRAFDLKTGAPKLRWAFPGDTSNCNDFAIAPDHTVYISETFNSRIYRLRPGQEVPELWIEDRSLYGIDGITLLDGVIYANTVFSNDIFRVPMDAAGKAMTPVELWLDHPVKGPDGMRAAGGRIFLGENRGGKVDMVTIDGDTAHITTIKDGFGSPTAVEPVGNTLWVGDRTNNKAVALPMP